MSNLQQAVACTCSSSLLIKIFAYLKFRFQDTKNYAKQATLFSFSSDREKQECSGKIWNTSIM